LGDLVVGASLRSETREAKLAWRQRVAPRSVALPESGDPALVSDPEDNSRQGATWICGVEETVIE